MTLKAIYGIIVLKLGKWQIISFPLSMYIQTKKYNYELIGFGRSIYSHVHYNCVVNPSTTATMTVDLYTKRQVLRSLDHSTLIHRHLQITRHGTLLQYSYRLGIKVFSKISSVRVVSAWIRSISCTLIGSWEGKTFLVRYYLFTQE